MVAVALRYFAVLFQVSLWQFTTTSCLFSRNDLGLKKWTKVYLIQAFLLYGSRRSLWNTCEWRWVLQAVLKITDSNLPVSGITFFTTYKCSTWFALVTALLVSSKVPKLWNLYTLPIGNFTVCFFSGVLWLFPVIVKLHTELQSVKAITVVLGKSSSWPAFIPALASSKLQHKNWIIPSTVVYIQPLWRTPIWS